METRLQAAISAEHQLFRIIQGFLIFLCLLMLEIIMWLFIRFERRRSSDMHLINKTNEELQQALLEVKTLQGIIHICIQCKKIRDEKGLWNNLEDYIHSHSEAEFSHGLCPECARDELDALERDLPK